MIIACLDTVINLPISLVSLTTAIASGATSTDNYPYISWKNVHDGLGGLAPGLTLSSILQIPASEWSTSGWNTFNLKWDEWIYVLHATCFFIVFGTTPEMRQYYRSALWFIPEHCGFKRRSASEEQTLSDVVFKSNPGQPTEKQHRDPLSFLESTIGMNAMGSVGMVEFRDSTVTTSHHSIETISVKADEGSLDSGK